MMQHDEIRAVVRETLIALGFDLENIGAAQADMAYLRRIRNTSDTLGLKVRMTIVASLTGTMLWLLVQGMKNILKGS